MTSTVPSDSPEFSVRISSRPTATVLAPVGELDVRTASELETRLREVDRTTPLVVVDLFETTFIDSNALNLLLHEHRAAEADGRRFAITRDTGIVQRLLSIAGLDDILLRVDPATI